MNRLKVLGIIVCAVVSAMAINVACASANALTSPKGFPYTGFIKAESEGPVTLHGIAEITCNAGTVEGTVEQHGAGVPVSGELTSMTFSECVGGIHIAIEKAGSLEVNAIEEGPNGTVASSGAKVTMNFTAFGIKCEYTTSETDLGTLTGTNSTNATFDIESASIPRTGGSIFCGGSGILTGSYKVTTPEALSVDPEPTEPGSALTNLSPSTYTSTIKAEAEGSTTIHGPEAITCKKSAFEGKIEQHGSSPAGGKLSSLSFSECGTNDVTVVKPGSLEIRATSGGNGTVISTGAEISVNMTSLGITCVYTTNNTDIGTFTGSTSTNATVDLTQGLPRTGGSYLCGYGAAWTGSYKFTTPSNLSVDTGTGGGSILTNLGGTTTYTSTIKAEAEGSAVLHGPAEISCKKSTFEGKIEQHGTGIVAGGKLSSLSFSECGTNDVTVVKSGSLEIYATSGGNGTVGSTGAEISINLTSLGITCIYSTNTTDIGTFTGSTSTNATIDLSGGIPRTAGNIACGASATLTGSYKFTTPSNLYVDEV
jgi:hypothetical protein